MRALHIQCRCGALGLEIAGEPIAQFFCHCDDCQAMHGAAYVSESVYPASSVRVTRGNPRLACPACATRSFVDVLAFGCGPARALRRF
jgi:hypothetical protein